jgi:uncharacterized protein (DUF362 family)/NAD-dependent dihydropyrimidine dehydrogenase PreA subunit
MAHDNTEKTARTTVALHRCGSYDPELLDRMLEDAAVTSGFPDVKGACILVKPNLLKSATIDKAVTTHPGFVAAVIRLLHRKGAARILVGDSPGYQNALAVARATGIYAATRDNAAEWVDFVPGNPRPAPGAKLVKSFSLASVLDECDLVVNLPKLKTHRLMNFTGAIKNLFGLVPNLGKSGMHLRFPDKTHFGTMLVDLAAAVGPCFTFMDGIIAMQGEGPGNGDPFELGLLLASSQPAALDWAAASIIGYDPRHLPYLVDAIERAGFDPGKPDFSIGPESIESVAAKDFELLPVRSSESVTLKEIPSFARNFMKRLTVDRPVFLPDKCTGCRACVKICPVKALGLDRSGGKNQIRIDDEACITCFCCHEVCPSRAIAVRRVFRRKASEKKMPDA